MTRPRNVPLFTALALAAAPVLAAALVVAGCGGGTQSTPRTLTERERDSTLGASAIPGAGAVTRTLATSDSMAARARRENAAAGSSGQ